MEETAATLRTAPGIPDPTPGSTNVIYSSLVPAPGADGVACERTVVVDFTQGSADPRARGIVPSYNAVVP